MSTPAPAIKGLSGSTAPAEPLLEPADYTEFLLRTKSEIHYVLRGLLANSDRITVYFNEGKDFLLTTVIAIDDEGITLDYGSNPEMNQRALAAEKVFCITSHEKVRVQFLLHGLRQVDYQGRPAFRAALPDSVLRLQRREYYRLTTPIARPLKCQIPTPSVDGTTSSVVDVNVVDISGGGLAIMVPPTGIPFEPEMKFPNCRIELPEVGILVATLQVRSIFDVTLRTGAQVTRAGCQFLNLPGPMLTLVQRYIIKVERERKARETGMA
ncbi:MAG TPA: flagellar brake protein [Rhodocyclaceae bacterium]|nr:flagellar brake protein [Rhodocyclaceae bacterium]